MPGTKAANFSLYLLGCLLPVILGGCSYTLDPKLAGYSHGELLIKAKNSIERGDLDQAWPILEWLNDQKTSRKDKEKLLYFRAFCYYKNNEAWNSFEELQKLADLFPISKYASKAAKMEFDIGKAFLKYKSGIFGLLSYTDNGLRVLKHLVMTYPTQSIYVSGKQDIIADDAMILIANTYWDDDDWENAALRYDQLIREYPECEWVKLARFRGGMACFNQIHGPAYDRRIMEKAERRLKDYLGKSEEGDKNLKEATAALEQTWDWLAEKEWIIAEYYMDLDSPLGVILPLEAIISKYPNTNLAKKAKKELPKWKKRHEKNAETQD